MTSELLILTPSAVTLASDSAVTIENRKTYNGVNKLFMLSNNPPMGIMTYNLANFLNIPLETIIKEFRKDICEKNISSLDEFKNEFQSFLSEIVNKSSYKQSFEDQLNFFITQIKEESKKFTNEKFEKIITQSVSNFNSKYLGDYYNQIMYKLKDNENELNKLIPKKLQEEKEEFLLNLKHFFIESAFLKHYTGIVIAGFEEKSLFPSSIHFKINYLYENNFILMDIEHDCIGENKVVLKPLAQGDVINTFLSSIDIQTQSNIIDYFENIYNNYSSSLKEVVEQNKKINGKEEIQILNEISKVEQQNKELSHSFSDFIEQLKEKHSRPIVESIASLPKEELSNLAESLIKITSLKRKVQSDLETVGGPVDVAIITKGDGFIWTKRKHYFKADLNPQFFNK